MLPPSDLSRCTLVGTVGLPYSGKSTWVRGHPGLENAHPVVCPDEIRAALHGQRYLARLEPMVWYIAHVMVEALFRAGHAAVILDATNTTPERRAEWEQGPWEVVWKVLDTPAEECIRRARAAGDEEIVTVIERMAEKWDPPEENVFP